MRNLTILICIIFTTHITYSQCDGRYQNEIFTSTNLTTVNYSDVYTDFRHEMDIYTAVGDTVTNRPVVFYMHGGSFYSGSKDMTDCVDFCTTMAKRGYVAISSNYRISQSPISFIYSQEEQFETVLKAVADIKAGIRYIRKDFDNGNTLGTDPNGIFIGGYSAGAVLSIHLAYIDQISDLPTTPIDVQNLVNNIGGTLEGDAGNNGFSSAVHGVFSFAGGINDLNWIDSNDEPLVSIQGDADQTVSYVCDNGLGLPTVLILCGTGEMHPQADAVGIINDYLTFSGEDHLWAASGNGNPKFGQAIDFTVNFLYPLLPCNQQTSVAEHIEKDFVIFPNPSKNYINLISSNNEINSYSLFNSIGQKLLSFEKVNKKEIKLNVSDFMPGIYFLQVVDNSDANCTKKVIIE